MNGIAIVRKLRNCSCVMDIEKKKKTQHFHFWKWKSPNSWYWCFLIFVERQNFFIRTLLSNLKNEFWAVFMCYQFIESHGTLASLIRLLGLLRGSITDGGSQCIIQSLLVGFSKARYLTTWLFRPFLELFPHLYYNGRHHDLL